MELIYASMLLHKVGQPVNEDNLKKVLHATGARVDEAKVKAVVAALDGVNIDEVIKEYMLTERQKIILTAAVENYISTAYPVASHALCKEHMLDVSPATIRNELLELDSLGYLEQPHTSAGRVPTDKGYRFFVEHLLDE